MYVTPFLLLLLASNVFADGTEDWQALFSNMGINTKETSCVVENFKVNLDTLMSLANKQQNEVNPEGSGDGTYKLLQNTPELTPLAGNCQTYHLSSVTTGFGGAVSSCYNSGLKIVTPNTDAKMQCLRTALRERGRYDYWIGATNVNKPFFLWIMTNEVAYLDPYWAGNSSELADRCIYISAVDGLIRDDVCTTDRRYICESA